MKFVGTILLLVLLWGAAPGPRVTGPSDAILDSARAEFDAGRYWHASRLLRSRADEDGRGLAEILLLARADAGWKNWSGVVEGLEAMDWLDEFEGAEGRRLMARALEAGEGTAPEASREARSAARAGRWESIVEALEVAGDESPTLVAWTALDVAEWSAERGDVARVGELLPWVRRDSTASDAAWDVRARALLAAADSGRALDAYLEHLEVETEDSRRGRAFAAVGELRLARGDSSGGRHAFLAALEAYPRGASGARSASALIEMKGLDADLALLAARTLDRAGDPRRSLVAYGRYEALLPDSVAIDPPVRLVMARLLSATGEHEAAVREFRQLVETDDLGFELRVLDQWLSTRRRQGRRDAVRTIQGWIIERFPESRQAVDIVFSWAAAAQDRGAHSEAAAGFEKAIGDCNPVARDTAHQLASGAWKTRPGISLSGAPCAPPELP